MTDPPRRQPGKRDTTKAGRAKLPTCGAHLRKKSGTCQRPAGWGTDHPGEGKCKLHGGVGQKPSTRYQLVNASGRLREAVEHQQADPTPLDLLPDLILARALLQNGIERHSEAMEALIAWHASHTSGYQEAVALWREQLALYLEAVQAGHSEPEMPPPPPPIPEAFENKPKQVPDVAAFIDKIDRITNIVERIQKREGERSIPLHEIDRVLSELGFKAVLALKEVIPDDADLSQNEPAELRRELGRALQRHWGTVRY